MLSDKLAAVMLLDDPAALADIADAADKAGRTALADLIDAELEALADDTVLKHRLTELLVAEDMDRNKVFELADHLRQAGFGKYADRLLNAGGQGARLMVLRDALRALEGGDISEKKEQPPPFLDSSQCVNCGKLLKEDEGLPTKGNAKVCFRCEYGGRVMDALKRLLDSGKLSPEDELEARNLYMSYEGEEEIFQKALEFLRKQVQDADDPLSFAPTPALEEIPTETGPKGSGMEPFFGREAPLSRRPTIEDVMSAISKQVPLDPSEMKSMSPKDLELLRTRLGLMLNIVEKAMGAEPTFLLKPEEQEKHEEAETLRGTIGAMKPLMTKRGGAWEHTPEAAIDYLKKLEKEQGEDTWLSKYPFPEKASGAVAALEPLHRMVTETLPRIKEMAKDVGWKLLNNLPEDRAELERLWPAASSLHSEMTDTGDEYIRTLSTVAQRTASQMKLAEGEKADRERWAELEPMGRRLLEELEPFSKGEEWHQEPTRTIKLLRENLDKGFRPRLIHQTEHWIERAQKVLQRLKAGEEPGFSYNER